MPEPGRASFGARLRDTVNQSGENTTWDTEIHKTAVKVPKGLRLIMCDVDGLKLVNDSAGHVAGDILLIEAGRAVPGDVVIMTAGAPPGTPGSTNNVRVHRVGASDGS